MFSHFGIKEIIDIFLVAVLLYNLYRMMKSSGNISIFNGVLAFIVLWIIVKPVFDMRLLGKIMDQLISVGVLVLVILFQDEIRRFLIELGSQNRWKNIWYRFSKGYKAESVEISYIMPIILACKKMSKEKTGALIVIEKTTSLAQIKSTGEVVNADISARLIESVFFKNSPLHDGAMIISNRRIANASCILPVSHNHNLPKELGLRHRAALGISQESDAQAIVVSEETGRISLASNGQLHLNLTAKDLEVLLSEKP